MEKQPLTRLKTGLDAKRNNMENVQNYSDQMDQITEKIKFGALSLDQEAMEIHTVCQLVLHIDDNLVTLRTKCWVRFGRLLNEHKSKVRSSGKNWGDWADKQFPCLGSVQCQVAMRVANFGRGVEPYYFLGLHMLDYFFGKLKMYHYHPEFREICSQFKLTFKVSIDNDSERADFKAKAEKVYEYFKAKGYLFELPVCVDKKGLIRVINAGVQLQKADLLELVPLRHSFQEMDDYFQALIDNGGRAKTEKVDGKQVSAVGLLSKIIQTGKVIVANEDYPEDICVELVDEMLGVWSLIRQKLAA